jgi:BirA family biotin operon repressor/biotin-[acetyl-CoA-carboxylase] ligase
MLKLGHTIVRLEQAASTNSLVLASEAYVDRHGLVVVARRQTAGRGRMGRTWHDLPGDQLFASIVAHPRMAAAETPVVALIAGLALAQAIQETAGLDVRLKWPNDALVRGRKAAGILVESSPGRTGAPRLVIGIGVNCQGGPGDIPPELRQRITTLSLEAGRPVGPQAVLQALLPRLDALLERLVAGERAALLGEWAQAARVSGRWVLLPGAAVPAHGIVQGISPEGHLVVEDVAGVRHRVVSGEVTWRD